jgi:hypothetical protein
MKVLRKIIIINPDYIMITYSIMSRQITKSLKKHKTLLLIMETLFIILIIINPNNSCKLTKLFKMGA